MSEPDLVQWPFKLELEAKVSEAFDNMLYGNVSWDQVKELRDYLTEQLDRHEEEKPLRR